MILKVARIGHPVVRSRAHDVEVGRISSPEFQRFIDDMVETMHEYDGVGLAAPQVHVGLRVAVLEVRRNPRYPEAPEIPLQVLVNPVVSPLGDDLVEGWEGCLSIPDLRGLVPRYRKIRVEALDRNGHPLNLVAEGFHARVIQHETDHLNGEVYLDRMPDMRSLSYLLEWQRYVVAPKD